MAVSKVLGSFEELGICKPRSMA